VSLTDLMAEERLSTSSCYFRWDFCVYRCFVLCSVYSICHLR